MKRNILITLKTIITLIIVLTSNGLNAQEKNEPEFFNAENNIAIEGYDLVSYFQGKPRKGKAAFSVHYDGVQFYFFSPENKEIFIENPIKYIPKYGGWCAYAMGVDGKRVGINPKTYKIAEGKLYLFYNKFPVNTLKSWNKNENSLRNKADKNWSQKINKKNEK